MVTPRILLVLALALSVPGSACYRAAASPGSVSSDRSLLTTAEVRDPRFSTAWEVIEALRGTWLHERGIGSFTHQTEIQVYIDGVRYGTVTTLKNVATTNVESIRFINGMDASTRWGLDHGKGVIYVTSSAGGPLKP